MVRTTSLIIFGSCVLFAQQGFEVASIKPSDPAIRRPLPLIQNANGRVDMKGITLRLLVQLAYGVRDSQIFGGPGWINSDRYDILATVAESAKDDQPTDESKLTDEQRKRNQDRMQELLRPLLADRFQLRVHRESRESPVYVLTVAKNGPKLKEEEVKDGEIPAGAMRTGRGMLMGSQIDIEFLARVLSQITGRTIVDRTGLKGKYHLDLRWNPDQSSANGVLGGIAPPRGPDEAPIDPDIPTIFVAVQEQLGLKLESGRGPVETIIIDHVDKPSEN